MPSSDALACPRPDPLTEVLDGFPLEIHFAGRFDLCPPWGLLLPESLALVATILQGRCLATADTAHEEVWASAGDLLLLSPGAEHRLRDSATTPVVPPSQWLAARRPDDPLVLSLGGPVLPTVLAGGVFYFDDPKVHPFCWGLPPVVRLAREDIARCVRLRRLFEAIDDELSAGLPGRQCIVKRLVEILFVETARLSLTAGDDSPENATRQFLHPDLGPALVLMHRQPEKPWTVAELAERVAMSRSAFAAAFVEVIGRPPVQYLRQRRMKLAARLLRNPALGLKEVALRVGYDSVSAFNSAFKRHTGIAPGQFRSRGE